MLLVETYLDRSPLSGIGVFTARAIAAGTRIWTPHPAVDLRFEPPDWESLLAGLSLPVREDMRRHSYKEGGRIVLCLDNARFMNHGGEASNVGNETASDTMFARRPIPAGSELTCDYREFSDEDDRHLQMLGIAPGVLSLASLELSGARGVACDGEAGLLRPPGSRG